jgi:hypothetical protein
MTCSGAGTDAGSAAEALGTRCAPIETQAQKEGLQATLPLSPE